MLIEQDHVDESSSSNKTSAAQGQHTGAPYTDHAEIPIPKMEF